MTDAQSVDDIDFSVDTQELYREETITDLKAASIRRLIPVKSDGSDDPGRTTIIIGSTQLMLPEGPLPIQAKLKATTLDEAYTEFPGAMKEALQEVIQNLQRLQQEKQAQQQQDSSRIIVPGR